MALALSSGKKLSTDRAMSNAFDFPRRGAASWLVQRRNFTPTEKMPLGFAALETVLNATRPRAQTKQDLEEDDDWDE